MSIVTSSFNDLLSARYLSYALSTIKSRSLPDVRDGLKPVHRRLLFAMSQLQLHANTPPKKSARVVGDVIGKFHPHGDVAVYDALVRLAQDFAVRYPLIFGQGNFGNIDGDNAAAMRYTEARLTEVAEALLEGLNEDSVDFQDTYDGYGQEPMVLPASFPNLLANGAQGIAVGMATSIPPHHVGEICQALQQLIDDPDTTIAQLVELIPGPDFPTGGELIEDKAMILQAYQTGRGGFRLRARWHKEELKQGQFQIVVTEIPYQVQKSRLIEKTADLLMAKKLLLLDDIRDESAEDIRLVLVPKNRNVNPVILMESLFRHTDLETRASLNMNVLDKNTVPRVMNLKQVLLGFLDHRHEVLQRRSAYRLEKINNRLQILDGYLIVYLNLDEVIRIIREEDHPKQHLMHHFHLNEVQVEAILNMRLRSLRRLEELEIRTEYKKLESEQDELRTLLDNEKQRWKVIGRQIHQIAQKFGKDKRRTLIGCPSTISDVSFEAMIEKEPVTVICSEKGWIRTVKGQVTDQSDLKYKDGDKSRFVLHLQTTDRLVLFASNGRFYTISVTQLPGGRGFGDPLRLMIDLSGDADILALKVHEPDQKLLIVAEDGRGFLVEEKHVIAQTKNGKQILNLPDDGRAKFCRPAIGDHVAVLGKNRKLLIFPTEELPTMTRGRGVILQKYRDSCLADLKFFSLERGLGRFHGLKARTDLLPWIGKRAQVGRLLSLK